MIFVNKRKTPEPTPLVKENCPDCGGEYWLTGTAVTRRCGCGKFELDEPAYLPNTSNKRGEKIGKVRI